MIGRQPISKNMSNIKQGMRQNGQLVGLVLISSVIIGGLSGLAANAFSVDLLKPWLESQGWSQSQNTVRVNHETVPAQIYNVQEESQTISAVEKINPSVVSIIITKDLSKISNVTGPNPFPFDDYFQFPGFQFQPVAPQPKSAPQKPNKQEVGGGSGFFISEDGLILTNKHVVADEDAEYSVLTNDGKRYDAKVLARDPSNDIAVVKIDGAGVKFTPVDLGDSDKLKLGQTVIAVGNSLGEYRNTVTKGVISGIGRRVTAGDNLGQSETIDEALQTDAAINPGNSGGPLVNIAGQVIGIDTAVNLQGQLIGFAIPINQAKQDIASVISVGKIVRPFLGVRYVLITEDMAKKNNLAVKYGALVLRGDKGELAIAPGSPADKAGITENDIILEVTGQKIDLDHPLAKLVGKYKPGDEVELKILHKGDNKTVKVKLVEFKES